MSTIDEIMEAVESVKTAAAEHQRWRPSAMRRIILEKETEGLCDLIAAALADARREGAEAMREAADQLRADADEIFPPSDRGRQAPVEVRDVVEWYSESIRALPLPTGSQS